MTMKTKAAAITIATVLAVTDASAADDVMVVFDGSNSMWGQIDGVAKIEIARDAISRLMGEWADGTNVGLMAYGHRRRGDCRDIETIIAPGPFSRPDFLSEVGEITPTGKTPLTTAVEEAARQLSHRDRPATVILISDGIESCDRDPCALADELERSGVRFTAHVVGFGLATAEEQAALSCIADRTGGEFIAASDASELEEALGRVSEVVADQPTPEPEPEPTPEPEPQVEITLTAPDTVTTGTRFDVGWNETLNPQDFITIVTTGADENEINAHVRTRDVLQAELRAPADPGLYEVRYVLSAERTVAGRRIIEVVGAAVDVTAPGSVIAGASFDISWTRNLDQRDFITIVPAGADDGKIQNHIRVRDSLQGELRAPAEPGIYEVRYVLDEGRRTIGAAIVEVSEATVTLSVPETVVAGAAFPINWSGVVNARDFITIVPAGADEGKIDTHMRTRDDLQGTLNAPGTAGLYEVRYVLDEGRRTLVAAMVEVTEPEAVINAPESVLAGAEFDVTWGTPIDGRDFVTIVPAGAPEGKIENHIRARDQRAGKLTAPGAPGLYEVRYVLDSGRRTIAVAMVELREPAVTLSAPETVRAGDQIEVSWAGDIPNSSDFVTIVPLGTDDGKIASAHIRVRGNTSGRLVAPQSTGLYEIRYVLDQGRRTLASVQIEIVDENAPLNTGGSLEVPGQAGPGQVVEVAWSTSSSSSRIRIALAKVNQPDFTWIEAQPAQASASTTFTMPIVPGAYEVRLLDLAGPTVLSRAVVEVR